MNRQFCRWFGTFVDERNAGVPSGDEENDDDRLIIICARVDPGFKDEEAPGEHWNNIGDFALHREVASVFSDAQSVAHVQL
ncbi:hypothetical protein K0M31_010768 [Melipona bicolor]|uniref:Uncharacterized protein n=1 Tax=Melipona bicolor TaxID=60889 RepID=A0AA40FL78_9HYME|nr:hypothetical protein K0M31_010768 [Melipona bicolor]